MGKRRCTLDAVPAERCGLKPFAGHGLHGVAKEGFDSSDGDAGFRHSLFVHRRAGSQLSAISRQSKTAPIGYPGKLPMSYLNQVASNPQQQGPERFSPPGGYVVETSGER